MTHAPDDLDLKRRLDALPRGIEPPTDAWPAIRSRIGDRGTGGPAADNEQRRAVPRFRGPAVRIAALLTLLAVSAGALLVSTRGAATWTLATAGGARALHAGDSLLAADSTRITVGRIGRLDVAAGTALRLVSARVTAQRLALSRGTIHATISAPPRLFVVETPSGTAVDLGCAYTLDVDEAGTSRIVVTAGWVEFHARGVRSLVPAGMRTAAWKDGTVGTPVRDSAAAELVSAVAAFDRAGTDSAVTEVLRTATRRDAVTLWHLVERTQGTARSRVVTKLAGFVPLPDGITQDEILRAEPHAMELYWTALPGTLPIVPSWQQALWKLWLKVGG